jgi:hypothetical protein
MAQWNNKSVLGGFLAVGGRKPQWNPTQVMLIFWKFIYFTSLIYVHTEGQSHMMPAARLDKRRNGLHGSFLYEQSHREA